MNISTDQETLKKIMFLSILKNIDTVDNYLKNGKLSRLSQGYV